MASLVEGEPIRLGDTRSGSRRQAEHVEVEWKGRSVNEAVVLGEELGAEVFGERDVERIGCCHVVPIAPGGVDERGDRSTVQPPTAEPSDGGSRLGFADDLLDEE